MARNHPGARWLRRRPDLLRISESEKPAVRGDMPGKTARRAATHDIRRDVDGG